MKILVIANFPSYLDGGKGKGRFLYLGDMLCERGHQVEMIVSDFDHCLKTCRTEGSIKHNAYKTKITVLHEPGYSNNISVKRLWSHYQWGRNVRKYLKTIEKPDVIYCAVPSMTAGVKVAKYCKKNDVRFVIDVQDLWPEAFKIFIKNKRLQIVLLPIKWYVNKIYSAADTVIGVSETYVARALSVNGKTEKGLSVFLGKDLQLFDAYRQSGKVVFDENDRSDTKDILRIAYIGTLGYSYDLCCAIRSISICKSMDAMPHIQFVVMGNGPLKKKYENYAYEVGIDCLFTGYLPYNDMVATMCRCDIVINPIIKGALQSITNKVADYALSGLPVVNTQENLEYRQLVENYHCGINCKVGDAENVAKALEVLCMNPILRKTMGNNSRKLGEDRFDCSSTYKQIVEILEQ